MFRRKNPSLGVLQVVGGVQMNNAFFMSVPFIGKTNVRSMSSVRSFQSKHPFIRIETRVRFSAETF